MLYTIGDEVIYNKIKGRIVGTSGSDHEVMVQMGPEGSPVKWVPESSPLLKRVEKEKPPEEKK